MLLIDVREPDEYQVCSIAGARLIPLNDLPNRIQELRGLADGKHVIAHCHHGGRSLSAASVLREAGFANARSMAGGIDEWSRVIDSSVPRY